MLDKMKLFHRIEEGVVVLRCRGGKFKQVPLYHRDGAVYAGLGGAFVRLLGPGSTTDPNTAWLEAGWPEALWQPGAKTPTYPYYGSAQRVA